MANRRTLQSIFNHLYKAYGPQHWWPGETPFEIMVGAVLTQNTAWTNVEKAIANLKEQGSLSPAAIVDADHDDLAQWIRPSGYFNIKARRLKNFCQWYLDQGGFESLKRLEDNDLRHALLSVNGVGAETADDIMLYAFERPCFVIDAYTRRLFQRLDLVEGDETYEQLRHWFENTLGPDVGLYNEYHALIVNHAKDICKPKPQCSSCCLRRRCPARCQ